MTKEQQLVKDFHLKFYHTVKTKPELPSERDLRLSLKLINEEERELFNAKSFIDFVDALGDLKYVVDGTALRCGVDLEPIFAEIHRSNMTKVWPDGSVRYDRDGKVIKPPTYSPADIAGELRKQGWVWHE